MRLEGELSVKSMQIADLQEQISMISMQLELAKDSYGPSSSINSVVNDSNLKKEVMTLRARLQILEDRERELVDQEVDKDRIIRQLSDQINRFDNEGSMKLE